MNNNRKFRPIRPALTFAAGFACGALTFAAFAAAVAPAPELAPPAEDAPAVTVEVPEVETPAVEVPEVEVPVETPAPAEPVETPAPAPEPVEVPAEEVTVTWDEGTLECGRDAGVAVDQDAEGNNWAYCEPGMIG